MESSERFDDIENEARDLAGRKRKNPTEKSVDFQSILNDKGLFNTETLVAASSVTGDHVSILKILDEYSSLNKKPAGDTNTILKRACTVLRKFGLEPIESDLKNLISMKQNNPRQETDDESVSVSDVKTIVTELLRGHGITDSALTDHMASSPKNSCATPIVSAVHSNSMPPAVGVSSYIQRQHPEIHRNGAIPIHQVQNECPQQLHHQQIMGGMAQQQLQQQQLMGGMAQQRLQQQQIIGGIGQQQLQQNQFMGGMTSLQQQPLMGVMAQLQQHPLLGGMTQLHQLQQQPVMGGMAQQQLQQLPLSGGMAQHNITHF